MWKWFRRRQRPTPPKPVVPKEKSSAKMKISAYDIAQRYVGVREVPGTKHNPLVLAMLKLDDDWPQSDEVPWCSGFMNWIAWHLRLPRSKSLMARSWLNVGRPIELKDAIPGFDVVILYRGDPNGPSGHVGWYAGQGEGYVKLLGGNQGNRVSIADYPKSRVIGVRRLLF
jgi:uncharacterized protein (TIGR02594 family)